MYLYRIYRQMLLLLMLAAGPAFAQTTDSTDLIQLGIKHLLQNDSIRLIKSRKVSFGGKVELNEADVPNTLRVITREQITQTHARTLRDVLNVFIPGMDVLPATFGYADRMNDVVYNRGILSDFAQQVLILWNGKNAFTETTFGMYINAIEFTLENIERIEVNSSPNPIYGSSAITTINLITREQSIEGIETHIALSPASLNSLRARDASGTSSTGSTLQSQRFTTIFGKNINDWHIGGSFQYYNDLGQAHPNRVVSGGWKEDMSQLRDGTPSAYSVTAHLTSPNKKLEIGLWNRGQRNTAFLSGGTSSPAQGADYDYFGSFTHAHAAYQLSTAFKLIAGASDFVFRNKTRSFEPIFMAEIGPDQKEIASSTGFNVYFPYGTEIKNYNVFSELIYQQTLGSRQQHNLVAGLRAEREGQYNATTFIWDPLVSQYYPTLDAQYVLAPNLHRTIYSTYLNDSWRISPQWLLNAGGRLSYYKMFTGNDVWNANAIGSLIYTPIAQFQWRLTYSSGFRPATLYDFDGRNFVPLVGNPSIQNETVQNFESAITYKSNRLKVELIPYYIRYTDGIIYLPNGTGSLVAQNGINADMIGAELTTSYYWDKESYFFVGLSRLASDNTNTRSQVPFVTREYVNGGINWNYRNRLNVNLTGYFRGPRVLYDLPVNTANGGQNTHFNLNTAVSYQLRAVMKLFVLVENVTDQLNWVPIALDGFMVPMRGRTVHLGATLRF